MNTIKIMKLNRTLRIRNRHFLAISAAMYLLLMLLSISSVSAQSELGVVWTKEYNDIPKELKGAPTNFLSQPLYYKTTNEIRYLITGAETTRDGFIAMMDESGNLLKYWKIPIPSYYDKYKGISLKQKSQEIGYPYNESEFGGRNLMLYGTYETNDVLNARITTAIMNTDGSILAFGFVNRFAAQYWKLPSDTENDFSPGSHSYVRLKEGVWKIRIDKDGNVIENVTARGAEAYDLYPISNGNVLLTGLDIHEASKVGANGGRGVGMLHEYDLQGNFIAERCPNDKDGVPIIGASQFLDGNMLLHGWSGTPAVKINPSNPNVILASFQASQVASGAVNMPMSGTPAVDGGGFFNPQFHTTVRPTGASFGKLNTDGTKGYTVLNTPSHRNLVYQNPLVLDKDRNKYVGTVEKNNKKYIYELTDKKTNYEIIEGDEYPNNTSLKAVSLQDGFFAMGQDPATRKISVAKLSTCANFKLNGGTSEASMRTGQSFQTRNIAHTGNKGTVTYKWTLTDITTGGNTIEGWSGIIKSGNTNTLPTQTFKLADGKNFATLQYNVIAVDKYNITGVEQTCQQSHTILIKIYRNLPDNIIIDESDCTIEFGSIDFAVKQTWSVKDIGQQNTGLLVGDLDNDGTPEIIAFSPDRKKILIRSGENGSDIASISIEDGSEVRATNGWYPVMTAALVDSDGDGMSEIIVPHPNKKLISYKTVKGNDGKLSFDKNWTSATLFEYPVVASTGNNGGLSDNGNQPFIADLNGDGTPEIIIYNKVYDAKTGKFLCNTEPLASAHVGRQDARVNKNVNFFSVGDFDNDGQLEIAAGGKVYKLNFKSDGTVSSSIWAQMANVKDGYTGVADINMDGKLDIVVLTSIAGTHTGKLQVWTPSAGGGTMVSELTIAMPNLYSGFPFIGDLDGDVGAINGVKYPEICFTIFKAVNAYKYVPNPSGTGGTLQSKWTLPTEDASGATGITLFDFNNDGKNEIVYRDQTLLRILNGVNDATPVLAGPSGSIECYSGTAYEYPVIADVNGNGAANICITCSNSYGGAENYIRLYESKESNWAPTRKVWNQVNYEPTLINEDLTATTLPIAKNTQFTVGSVTHTPYNGTLIQVPIIDLDMKTVVVAADAYIDKIQVTWVDKEKGIVQLSVIVGNQGIVNTDKDLPITLYKNSIDPGNIIASKIIGTAIKRNTKVVVDFGQFKVDELQDTYIVRVQDNNGTFVDKFLDCKKENNTQTFDGLFLNDDSFIAYLGVETNLNVTNNDVLPATCTGMTFSIISGPAHGTATIDGTIIKYTSDPNLPIQKGQDEPDDELIYQIQCGSKVGTAKVKIKIVPKPDNIDDAHCFVEPIATDWGIKEDYVSAMEVQTFALPLVGDVDGDGDVEIITWNYGGNIRQANKIIIYNNQLNIKYSIPTPTTGHMNSSPAHMAIADVDNDGKSEIFALIATETNNAKLFCYKYDASNANKWSKKWEIAGVGHCNSIPTVADLRGTGKPVVIISGMIVDANTGNLIATLPAGKPYGLTDHATTANNESVVFTTVGDMDNDGLLEIIAGTAVYKLNEDNTVSIVSELPASAIPGLLDDGATSVADINLDGYLDVVVVARNTARNASYTYVWDVRKQELIGEPMKNNEGTIPKGYGSRAFIGDVDKDNYPEIALSYHNGMVCWKLDPITKDKFTLKWRKSTTDESGLTTMTMFDFNQDKKQEIVYRDMSHLRIIDGETGENIKTFDCKSWTGTEYPIVADINNDGNAKIIVSGVRKNESYEKAARLMVFSSEKAGDWAPARSVWNQYAYNAVNVNDNLTIPKYQLNPATKFPGKDGQLGTEDDTRPYNGYLMQQTRLSRDGVPLFLTPDALIINPENIKFDYDIEADKMKITGLTIKNEGSASLQSPIRISVYKDESNKPDGKKITFEWNKVIAKGESATITAADNFVIDNFHGFLPTNSLQIRINDKGNGANDQLVCNSCCVTNGSGDFSIPFDAMGAANKYKHCAGSTVTLTGADKSVLKGEPIYTWFKPDGVSTIGASKSVIYSPLALTDGGRYILTASNIGNNSNLSVTYKLPYLSVAPKEMHWKSDATNNNWNDLANWLDESKTAIMAVPAECTTVHIPAISTNYPSLSETAGTSITATDWSLYGQPEADNIVYHYGSEVAYPHKLKYNKAYVQYNFGYYNTYTGGQPTQNKEAGSPVLKRDIWYPLAAPLKEMVSGDFAFGGYPATWQAMPDILSGSSNLNSVNFSKNLGKNDQPLAAANNMIALKAPLWSTAKGSSDQKHLENLQGVLEIPYFEDGSHKDDHPSHSYDPISTTSTYYYYDSQTLQQVGSPVGTLKRRNDNAYRFIFEKDDKTVTNVTINGVSVPCYSIQVTPNNSKQVLIGNPFIASISMDHFQKANSGTIQGTTFNTYHPTDKTWKPYNYTVSSVNPLQAFVVTLNTTSAVTLNFPLEGDWALTGKGGTKVPRRLETPGAIAVTVSNQSGKGGDYAELTPAHEQTVNVSKLISDEGHALPEAFFIDQTGSSYNLIQTYEQGISEVGLGIKCSDTQNELTLTFEHIEAFGQLNNTHPVLVDKLLGVEQDLTANSTYRFRQHTSANPQSQYADKKRFAIRFGEDSSANNNDTLQVIYTNSHLEIKSTIKAIGVEVYNLSGQLLFNSGTIGTTNYHQYLPLTQGSYIVKVKTEDNKSNSKKIMAL